VNLVGRTVLGVTNRKVVRRIITATRPGRAVATRFVAGESLDDVVRVARELNGRGAAVSLDHLGEHVADQAQAVAARDDYLACLDRIGVEGIDGNISVKLSQLGMGLDNELAAASLDTLAVRAAAVGTTVSVDMEESTVTGTTIDLYREVQSRRGNLGIALQAYLHRTPADLDALLPLGGHIRLCKGAYAEPESVALQTRRQVDAAFDHLLEPLMRDERVTPAVATHDSGRLDTARRLAAGRAGRWEFQMLYGVRPALQDSMLTAGDALRIYVPYGIAWYPYLTRRLAERPANLAFFMRALVSRT
jgi:proline dehydrogenase